MMSHLDTCGILTNDQHGFMKGLSTETQLLAAVHDWSRTLHKGGQTAVLFLDFSKALTLSLIVGFSRSWGSSSHWAPVTSGVPQGTAIGPILFLIYINDIQSGISSRMRLFADDSVIYRTINSYSDHLALRDDLTKLWASKRQMTFKPEKCYVMSITNKIHVSKFQYCLKGVLLQPCHLGPI